MGQKWTHSETILRLSGHPLYKQSSYCHIKTPRNIKPFKFPHNNASHLNRLYADSLREEKNPKKSPLKLIEIWSNFYQQVLRKLYSHFQPYNTRSKMIYIFFNPEGTHITNSLLAGHKQPN